MTIRPHRPLTGLVLAALLLTACAGPTRTARPPAVTPADFMSDRIPEDSDAVSLTRISGTSFCPQSTAPVRASV